MDFSETIHIITLGPDLLVEIRLGNGAVYRTVTIKNDGSVVVSDDEQINHTQAEAEAIPSPPVTHSRSFRPWPGDGER